MKRGQSAIEFMILIGVVLFFITGMLGIFQQETARKSMEKRNIVMTELVLSVQNEINIAAKSTDGYMRRFGIPQTLAGKEYSIGVYEGLIYLNTTDGKLAFALPTHNVTGQLVKGTNTIRKINATIFVN